MKRSYFGLTLPAAGLLFLLCFSPCFSVKAQDLPTGKVIEKVVCQTNASHSYALYLPSNYTPEKRWPILYGFDPGARGLMPVERFKEAAEKYGYIVAGSNNSRNGPGVPLSEIVKALLEDTHTRFSIDDRRVYATGLSGGARVACMVAEALKGGIVGVIACGAGFPPGAGPSKNTPFIFFGTAGSEDFNLIELKELDKTLDSLSITHRVVIFEGGHAWAPKELCAEAIEWMELQAMRAGRKEKDDKLIAELWAKGLKQARESEEAKKVYDAYVRYQALADGFKGLREVAEFENKANQLKSSKEVKAYLKQEKEEEQKQRAGMNEFFSRYGQLKESDNRMAAIRDLKNMIADWRKKADEKEATSDRIAARRLLTQFSVSLSEEATMMRQQKNYEQAAIALTLAAEIRPDNPQALYRLADVYALGGKKKQALETLKRAVEKGFSDAAEIERNQNFSSLRHEAEYQQLIEALRRKK